MKIVDIDIVPVAVPLDLFGNYEPVTMWYGTRHASRHAVIFIKTDEDITGVGTMNIHRDIPGDTSLDLLHIFKQRLIGQDPFNIRKIEELTKRISAGRRPDAVAAVDIACWDIMGKALGVPVYKLLGGKIRDKIEVEFWECCKSPEALAADIKKGVELGWRAFKIKIGTDPPTDILRVKAAREAAGDDVELGFDVNDAYTVPTAIRTIKKMEKYDPAYIEQPVPSWDIDGLAEVKAHVDVPIVCHSYYAVKDKRSVLELVEKNAADILNINPDYMGSLLYCQEVAAIAEAGGIICKGQSTCAELGPANAALLHLIASTPAFSTTNQNSAHHLEKSGDIITKPFKTIKGCIDVPEGPGLGVEIDKDKLDRWHEAWVKGLYKHEPGLGRASIYYWTMAYQVTL